VWCLPTSKIYPFKEQLKMSKSRVAGSRKEFLDGWKEWAREINRLAYQSDDSVTIMSAIDLRIQMLALIDEIADQIYQDGFFPHEYDMSPFSPFSPFSPEDDHDPAAD
jgi:hypothetical protein